MLVLSVKGKQIVSMRRIIRAYGNAANAFRKNEVIDFVHELSDFAIVTRRPTVQPFRTERLIVPSGGGRRCGQPGMSMDRTQTNVADQHGGREEDDKCPETRCDAVAADRYNAPIGAEPGHRIKSDAVTQTADAVIQYLISQGLNPDHVTPRGPGDSNPVERHGSRSSEEQAGRVEAREYVSLSIVDSWPPAAGRQRRQLMKPRILESRTA
jgi:hypothetical protein